MIIYDLIRISVGLNSIEIVDSNILRVQELAETPLKEMLSQVKVPKGC